jgi:hypothetical protein
MFHLRELDDLAERHRRGSRRCEANRESSPPASPVSVPQLHLCGVLQLRAAGRAGQSSRAMTASRDRDHFDGEEALGICGGSKLHQISSIPQGKNHILSKG